MAKTLKLISPDDGSALLPAGGDLTDSSGNRYPNRGGVFDLSPVKPVQGTFPYTLIDHDYFRNFSFSKAPVPLYPDNKNKVKANGTKGDNVIGFIPPPEGEAFCLDHGCGSGWLRPLVESLGYNYVGADNYSGTTTVQGGGEVFLGGATHFCDLHRLPFADNTFQFSASYSVFEHLQNPFVAAAELYRVMKPGGIGYMAIADLIPFHMDSFYHHTHFGALNLFKTVGFEVLQVAGADWNGYLAISSMDGLPGPKFLRIPLSGLLYRMHMLLWRLRTWRKGKSWEAEDLRRHNMMAGTMKAVIRKPLT